MHTDRLEMLQMTTGYWVSKMIYCAARLKVADHLARGPATAAEIAVKSECHAESLHRLLRALASLGIFRETSGGKFELTPKAQYLRSDHVEGVRDFAVMINDDLFEAWCDIYHSVKTGESAVHKRFGGDFFSAVLSKNPDKSATFDRAMEQIHGVEIQLMLEFYDWSRFACIADVGGGSGQTLFAILERHPSAKGILIDLPDVVSRARAAQHPASKRCAFHGGSFFDSVPSGADCYFLRHIVHDWNDADSIKILRACRAAMGKDARLVIVEKAIPQGNEPEFAKLLDINMLAIGGKERTLAQYEKLFVDSGLKLAQHYPTPGPTDLIEARPA
ncbi:MAG: methyltransferase [Planctomycetes bacterium]|nr:methyltransferase [Planctomycetota bacterium]